MIRVSFLLLGLVLGCGLKSNDELGDVCNPNLGPCNGGFGGDNVVPLPSNQNYNNTTNTTNTQTTTNTTTPNKTTTTSGKLTCILKLADFEGCVETRYDAVCVGGKAIGDCSGYSAYNKCLFMFQARGKFVSGDLYAAGIADRESCNAVKDALTAQGFDNALATFSAN